MSAVLGVPLAFPQRSYMMSVECRAGDIRLFHSYKTTDCPVSVEYDRRIRVVARYLGIAVWEKASSRLHWGRGNFEISSQVHVFVLC